MLLFNSRPKLPTGDSTDLSACPKGSSTSTYASLSAQLPNTPLAPVQVLTILHSLTKARLLVVILVFLDLLLILISQCVLSNVFLKRFWDLCTDQYWCSALVLRLWWEALSGLSGHPGLTLIWYLYSFGGLSKAQVLLCVTHLFRPNSPLLPQGSLYSQIHPHRMQVPAWLPSASHPAILPMIPSAPGIPESLLIW